jgi:hypothetical protein
MGVSEFILALLLIFKKGGITMQYEYKVVVHSRDRYNPSDPDKSSSVESVLNQLGREGWELVAWNNPAGANITYIFKRAK